LQQLRSLVVSPELSQLPELTETQLQEMEEAFTRWRERSGDLQIPNLGGIPSAWIDTAIEDPAIRSHAQRLLERYARDRSITPTASQSQIPGSDSIERSSGQPGAQLSPHPLSAPDARPRDKETGDPGPNELGPAGTRGGAPIAGDDVPPIDSERMQGLRELFESLMSGDKRRRAFNSLQQQMEEAQLRKKVKELTKSARTEPIENGNLSSPGRSSSRTTQGRGSFGGPYRQTDPFAENPVRRGQGPGVPPSDDSTAVAPAELLNSMLSPKEPPALRSPERPSADVIQENYPSQQTVDQEQTRSPGQNRPNNSPDASSNPTSDNTTSGFDIKRYVDEHGLGATLQRIIERTVEERKQNLKSADAAVSGRGGGESSSEMPEGVAESAEQQHRQRTARQLSASARASSVGNDSITRLRHLIADVWKSIATVPRATPGAVDRAQPPKLQTPEVSSLARRLSAGLWPLAIVVLAVLILASLMLARKEVRRVESNAARDDVWVKEILRVGLRTRADVVRAFHHFALRRPEPAASWWTHRYVAARLSESSPNLRSVINELTNVYEEARYLPPDVQLSAEQIERVHQAFRLAEAGDA
jgi:hypothetical protein